MLPEGEEKGVVLAEKERSLVAGSALARFRKKGTPWHDLEKK